MKNKSVIIVLIVVLVIIALLLIGFMISFIGGNHHFRMRTRISDELVLDKTYESGFQSILVNAEDSEIELKVTNDNTFRAVVYGDEERTFIKDDTERLEIESKAKKCFGICFNQKSAKISIQVPANYEGEIELNNKYGDIKVDNIQKSNININADCGDVSVLGVSDAHIKNDYGNITLDYAVKANILASCGDVFVGEVDEIDVDNKYGNIKIKKVNNYLGLKDSCGDIKVDEVNLNRNSRIKNDLGNIEIGSTNEIYIDASAKLGDIDIKNNYRQAFVTLVLDNSCGDIKVNN